MKRKYTSNIPIEGFSKVVCHKDSNPRNNRVTNLYWGTQKENIQQCIREGKFYYVGKIRKKQYEENFKRTHGMES